MAKRVLVETPDLLFRSKLAAAVTAAGGEVTRDAGACDLAVLELGPVDARDRIRAFVARGIPVVAYNAVNTLVAETPDRVVALRDGRLAPDPA